MEKTSFAACDVWESEASAMEISVRDSSHSSSSSSASVLASASSKRLPVRKRVSLPSLLRIFSKIREERRTQPSLTIADSISAPSQDRGMSEIHSFVVRLSFPSCPFRIKEFLSYRDNAWPRRLRPSISSWDRAGHDSG